MRTDDRVSDYIFDVGGQPIPHENVVIDTDGNSYNAAKIEYLDGNWCYNGKVLLIGLTGNATGFKADGWRQQSLDLDESETSDDAQTHLSAPSSPTENYSPLSTGMRRGHFLPRFSKLLVASNTEQPGVTPRFDLDHDTIFDRVRKSVSDGTTPRSLPAQRGNRKQYHGYEAEVLIYTVAIHCQPCRQSSLISPGDLRIFEQSSFGDVPLKIYETMRPAMALAERLITKGSMQFWVSICCGRREYRLDHATGCLQECLVPPAQPTGTDLHVTVQRLQQMGERMKIGFELIDGGYARSRPARTPHQRIHHEADPWSTFQDIHLDSSLYHVLEKYSRLQYPDPAAKLRFDFFLAVILCHEIAHAFETKCGDYCYLNFLQSQGVLAGINGIPHRTHEAIWHGDKYAEVGAKWEIFTFGDRIKPINHGCDVRYGLVLYNGDWFDCSLFNSNAEDRTRNLKANSVVISMGYVEEIQQESFWSQPGHRNMRPPRIGPRNIFTGTDTSTMSWRRYLLEKEAEDVQARQGALYIQDAARRPRIEPPEALQPLHKPHRHPLQTPIQAFTTGFNHDPRVVYQAMETFSKYEQDECDSLRTAEAAVQENNRRYKAPNPDQASEIFTNISSIQAHPHGPLHPTTRTSTTTPRVPPMTPYAYRQNACDYLTSGC